MAKQMVGQAKFQVPGGQATPAPPVGTSLGRFGINLGQFVSQFNDRTREAAGMPIRDGEYARRMIEGTARSMGITVEG
jgi:large subunit ribosomal protein L11